MKKKFHTQMSCPICGKDSTLKNSVKSINPKSNKMFELRECKVCMHWWHSPMPYQNYLDDLYKSSSEFVVPLNYKDIIKTKPMKVQIGFNSWVFNNEEKNTGSKCLEIGVGGGHLFNFLLEKGYDCHGIELGEWGQLPKVFSDIKLLPYGSYDFIIAGDVLEHLKGPLSMLKKLETRCTKGSRIYCSFPNKDSFPAKWKKGMWRMVLPVGHLHYFSKKSVRCLFGATRFKIEQMKSIDNNIFHNNFWSNLRSNPIGIINKIKYIPYSYNDQFWVKALRE